MSRVLPVLCGLVILLPLHADEVKPPSPRDYATPGGVGPSRGWYIWHKFNPETWEVEVSRDPPGETWKARVLPYCTTYRCLAYGARPDELLSGERVNLFFAPDGKSRWGYVCHFQDELSQMKGHNHAWQIRSVNEGGFKASLWMGNEKKLDDKESEFTIDPKCAKWLGGRRVEEFALKPGDHVYMTWVFRKDRRVALLLTDAASLEAIKNQEQAKIVKEVGAEGVAGNVEGVEGNRVRMLIFSTYWAQMRDFKPGQAVTIRETGKGYRPNGTPVVGKLVTAKTGGPYGSGPTDVVIEAAGDAAAQLKAWADARVVRLAGAPEKRVSVKATILSESGEPLAARVYVQDAAGTLLEKRIRSLDAKGSAVSYARRRLPGVEVHTTVSAHPFAVDLTPGKYTFTIERGKEYHTLTQEVTVGEKPEPVAFRLKRWIDMPARGWYSGDTHVHRTLEEVPNAVLAEDLNVALPLSYWVTEAYASPAKDSKIKNAEMGRLIEVDKTHVIYPRNTEYEIFTVDRKNHMLGAFFVLNHKTVLDQGVPPVRPIAELAHKEGALIELDKHNWPWTMAIVPLMKADLYELTNNHVWRTEFSIPDWAEREAPYMKVERDAKGWTERGWIDYGMQNYYALLNCGFKLKPTGGTGSGVHPVPLGFGRVYVHLPEGFSYDAWMKGLAAGHSFVTTGPMFPNTSFNLKPSGHVFSKAGNYVVKGTAVNSSPIDRIEIIVNGEVVKTIRPDGIARAGMFGEAFEEEVKITGSSWIAVRCFEDLPNKRIRFAHTAPVWIDVAGKPIRPRKEEIDYLIKRVDDQIKRSGGVIPTEALDEYRAALKVYQALAAGAEDKKPADEEFDVLIRGGTLYDGSGQAPRRGDIGIRGDRIVALGDLAAAKAKTVIDAKGLAVAPGFINMLSWSNESLLVDGRGQSEIRQGVTTEIMGEGWSMGPVNPAIKKRMKAEMADIKYDIEWNTLAEYLYFLQRKGVSPNVASYLGAATVREYVLGLEDRKPSAEQMEQMRQLVEREMRGGALGIGSALEYAPAYYADTTELIELCKVAAKYKGKYITHMRSEGERLLEGIDEALRICREANIPLEVYHLKAAGKNNWKKMDAAVAKLEAARKDGLPVTANMYVYQAGGAPLSACIPPWAMVGGEVAMRRRLRDPESRKRILDDIRNKTDWPNFYHNAGTPDRLMLISFKKEALKPLQGKTLEAIAKERKKDPVETILDLLVEDESGIGTVYFITAEENLRKLVGLPWISFGSDEAAQMPEGIFLKSMPHPRAYGNFARVLGKYVREEKRLSLELAIRKMSGLPAGNLGLDRRGLLKEGYFADIAVFDPATIIDKATYEKPHQYAVGMRHVLVNGVAVLKDGEHTGAKPGRALGGPGKVEK